MTKQDIDAMWEMMEQIMLAPNKASAKPLLDQLRFRASHLDLPPYAQGKLNEAIGYAAEASGQVREKEHWMSCAKSSWYVFKSNIDDLSKNDQKE